jgi:hypothetical protein
VSRTAKERLADISDAADGVRRAVQALERAESEKAEDAPQWNSSGMPWTDSPPPTIDAAPPATSAPGVLAT